MADLTSSEKMTTSMIKAINSKNELNATEKKAIAIIEDLKKIDLTNIEILTFLDVIKSRVNLLIELDNLDEKYKDNA
jgi:hypothetical protein